MIFIIFTHFQNECHKNIENFVTLSFVYAINKYNVAFVDFQFFSSVVVVVEMPDSFLVVIQNVRGKLNRQVCDRLEFAQSCHQILIYVYFLTHILSNKINMFLFWLISFDLKQ